MSTTALKLFALIIMVIDHIGEFIPSMPIYLRWIGRISAPLFIFCLVWGFHYTHSRKRYLIRLYTASVLMSLVDVLLNTYPISNHFIYVGNNIFSTLFAICVLIALIEYALQNPKTRKKYILYFSIWQIASIAITLIIDTFWSSITPLCLALSGNMFYIEGGLPFVLLGVFLYFYKNNKKSLCITYITFCVSYFIISYFSLVARIVGEIDHSLPRIGNILSIPVSLLGFECVFITPISMESLLNYNFQWALIFALPFMLLYNHQRGKDLKYFFYFFYPLHIIILSYLGNFFSFPAV